jgi:hypothetical protein
MLAQIIIVIMGFGLLYVGATLWQKSNHLQARGKKAGGTIYRNNVTESSKGQPMYHPVVRFQNEKDEWVTKELDIGSSVPMEEGRYVEVIYDPEDLSIVEINSTLRIVILPRLFVVVGLLLLSFAVLEFLEITSYIPALGSLHIR